MGRSKQTRACLDWKKRDDQSHWAACEIGGQQGVVALIENDHSEVSVTAVVELFCLGRPATIDAAKSAVENWLSEIRNNQAVTGKEAALPTRIKK